MQITKIQRDKIFWIRRQQRLWCFFRAFFSLWVAVYCAEATVALAFIFWLGIICLNIIFTTNGQICFACCTLMRVKLVAKWQMESPTGQLLRFKGASRVVQCKWRHCASRIASLQFIYDRLNAPICPVPLSPSSQTVATLRRTLTEDLRQGLCDNCQLCHCHQHHHHQCPETGAFPFYMWLLIAVLFFSKVVTDIKTLIH